MRAGNVGEMEVVVGEGFDEVFLKGGGFVAEEEGGLGEAVEHEDFEGGGGSGRGSGSGGWHGAGDWGNGGRGVDWEDLGFGGEGSTEGY